MAAFGRLRLDVANCVRELVDFGVIRRLSGDPVRYQFHRQGGPIAPLVEAFLERRATVSTEDQSPAVQRFREMIGRDEKMLIVFEWIRTAAKSDISVLILGPTGSGKELVARMIHDLSRRSEAKFQAVNCAALPDTLFESEIFGYEKGAFTGAHDRKPGRLELANDGTLFLDEIGDLSIVAQAKLLRVLEERRFERLGGNRSISVDFRLISATNRPLDLFVRDGRFREDLLLPGQRVCHPAAFAAGTPGRHSGACATLSRALLCDQRPAAGRQELRQGRGGPAGRLSVAGQHPRARKHGVARGAVVAGNGHPRQRHRVPARFCRDPQRRRATGCRRCERPSVGTSCACSSRWAGTRRRRPACSTSVAAPSTGRSKNTSSSPHERLETAHGKTGNNRPTAPILRSSCSVSRHRESAKCCVTGEICQPDHKPACYFETRQGWTRGRQARVGAANIGVK